MQCLQHGLSTLQEAFSLLARSPSTLIFSSDPMYFSLVFVVSLMVACFVVSIILDNYSQVDRWWSVLPPALITFYWYRSPVLDARLTLMMLLSVAWGMRLTYNFWRKGGYNWKDEDYRWQPLKATIRPMPVWLLFNAVFICFFQLTLLFLISSPVAIVYHYAGKVPLGTVDVLLLFAFVLLLTLESIADQQQWIFQNEKHRLIKKGAALTGDYKLGFLTRGLFQFTRHPNFVCEISLWWVMYAFSVNASGVALHWSLAGPVLLTLLFQGSTNFTEKLSLAKYPEYAKYQLSTSRLLPWFPGKAVKPDSAATPANKPSTTTTAPKSPKAAKVTSNAPKSPKVVRVEKKTNLENAEKKSDAKTAAPTASVTSIANETEKKKKPSTTTTTSTTPSKTVTVTPSKKKETNLSSPKGRSSAATSSTPRK